MNIKGAGKVKWHAIKELARPSTGYGNTVDSWYKVHGFVQQKLTLQAGWPNIQTILLIAYPFRSAQNWPYIRKRPCIRGLFKPCAASQQSWYVLTTVRTSDWVIFVEKWRESEWEGWVMSWLNDLAGQAEKLLTKIDQGWTR